MKRDNFNVETCNVLIVRIVYVPERKINKNKMNKIKKLKKNNN